MALLLVANDVCRCCCVLWFILISLWWKHQYCGWACPCGTSLRVFGCRFCASTLHSTGLFVCLHIFYIDLLLIPSIDITQIYLLFNTMYFSTSAAWKACILIWENAAVAPLFFWTASAGARCVLLFEFLFDCSWQSCQVGMTSLAKSPVAAIRMALDGLEFIHSHLGVGKGNNEKFLQVKA